MSLSDYETIEKIGYGAFAEAWLVNLKSDKSQQVADLLLYNRALFI